jgi:hypothetical protein
MDWKQKIDYFKRIGAFKTAEIARDSNHPLCIDAIDYIEEKE